MIFSHKNEAYASRHEGEQYNGAYYYSREIVNRIIPYVQTDRNWVTINVEGQGFNHAIVFIHNNKNPMMYEWLRKYNDLILVCGIPETCNKVRHLGKTLYLPLSVDVHEVEQFRCEKDKDTAYVGRQGKRERYTFPTGTDFIEGVDRYTLLTEMARYKRVYAVGRTAIEAKILGCEVLPYDIRFPNPSIWRIFDSADAVKILQEKLDRIDRR